MINKIVLKNGVTIVLEKMDSVRSVCFGIYVRSGSVYENEKNNGISHFIEHIMFKGTEKRTAKDIAEEIDEMGAQINAYTTKEYTCYYVRALDTKINKAIEVLADMFFNSKFDEKEIKKEAKVIVEEIKMYEDDPEDLVFVELQKDIWNENSVSYPIIGKKENVLSFTKDDLKDYVNDRYTANNIVISVAGNFDEVQIIDLIKGYFENLKSSDENYIEKVPDYKKVMIKVNKDIEQLHLNLTFPSIKIEHKHKYSMAILNTIFGGGMSSLLFQKLREQNGLAYSVYSYNTSYISTGIFSIYMGLNKENIQEALTMIVDVIKDVKKNGFNKKQIEKTKEQLKSNYIMNLESTNSRMGNMGVSYLLRGYTLETDDIIKLVDEIDEIMLTEIIDMVFDFNKMSCCIVGKTDNIDIEDMIKTCIK